MNARTGMKDEVNKILSIKGSGKPYQGRRKKNTQ
jgi:hypothetical protein